MTNNKYTPEPRDYEQRDWLYERYWGEMMPMQEIADEADVSKDTIKRNLRDAGIPGRTRRFRRSNTISAFRGFYGDKESVPVDPGTDPVTQQPEKETWDPTKLNWQRIARESDEISDSAVIGD